MAIMASVKDKDNAYARQIRDARRNVVAIQKRFGDGEPNWKETGTFLDCGANIGEVTRAAADLFVRVVAVEAHPETAKVLRDRTRRLKNVIVKTAAVSNVTGRMFYVSSPSHCAVGTTARSVPRRDMADYYKRVKSVSLADLIKAWEPVAIKMDIEGSEFDALATITLPPSVQYMIVEFHGKPDRIGPIIKHLQRQGYGVDGYKPKSSYTLQTVKFERRER